MKQAIEKVTTWELLKFYIPIALQVAAANFANPLVQSVVNQGSVENAINPFSEGQNLMYIMSAVGAGLLTTAMVFCRTKRGFTNFLKVNFVIMAIAVGLQLLITIPPFSELYFSNFLHFNTPELKRISIISTRWDSFIIAAFFIRNIPQAILFNAKRASLAAIGSFASIFFTLFASWACRKYTQCGYTWALAISITTIFVEIIIGMFFAISYIRKLPKEGESGSVSRQLAFTLPLSVGGLIMNSCPPIIRYFMSQTPSAETYCQIHNLVYALSLAMGWVAWNTQSVAITFSPKKYGIARVQKFAIGVAITLSLILFLISYIRPLSVAYFQKMQNLDSSLIGIATTTLAIGALFPFFRALQGYAEGIAATYHKSWIILLGQATYAIVLTIIAATLTHFIPKYGYLIGISSVASAAFFATAIVQITVHNTCREKNIEGI